MTLNNIFDNVQYGEKYFKDKALREEAEKFYDKEFDIYYASKRIKNLSGRVVMTESEEQKVNRIVSKLTILEGRIESGNTMSEAYRKMQTAAIADDCKTLMEEVTKARKTDSKKLEVFGKIVAATKYFSKENLDEGIVIKESNNPLFNKIMNDEMNLIEEVVSE
jgi:hypothetical protein